MKKIFFGVCAAFGLIGSIALGTINNEPASIRALAEETTPEVTEPAPTPWAEETYTFADESTGNFFVIVLTSETECKLTVVIDGTAEERNVAYKKENNTLTVYLQDEKYIKFTINEDKTLTFVEENLTEKFECNVKITEALGGTIIVEETQGHVGDVVELEIKPDVFYMLTNITVNGNALIAGEDGKYSFILVEGENVVTPTFEVDEKLIGRFSDIYANIKAGNWTEIFNVGNILALLDWILNGAIGIALVKILSKYKKLKSISQMDVQKKVNEVVDQLNIDVPKSMETLMTNMINTVLTPILTKLSNVEESNKVFARCLALAQENTPESRLAIIDELSKIKLTTPDMIEDVRKFIKEECEAVKKAYEDQINALQEANAANEKILEETKSDSKTEETESKNRPVE